MLGPATSMTFLTVMFLDFWCEKVARKADKLSFSDNSVQSKFVHQVFVVFCIRALLVKSVTNSNILPAPYKAKFNFQRILFLYRLNIFC